MRSDARGTEAVLSEYYNAEVSEAHFLLCYRKFHKVDSRCIIKSVETWIGGDKRHLSVKIIAVFFSVYLYDMVILDIGLFCHSKKQGYLGQRIWIRSIKIPGIISGALSLEL